VSIAGNERAMKRSIRVGGQSLEIRAWPGAGTPILLLHEGLGSVSMWRDFPDKLASRTGRPVIAWSRIGHGWSDPSTEPFEPDYMHREADRVPMLMDALGLKRATLLGHSDGGSIALIAAARFPDRVAALILEAPHVCVEQLTVDSIAALRQTDLETELEAKLAKHHRDPGEVFWRWNNIWLDARFREWSIEALLPAINARTLMVQGQDDEYGTIRQLDLIERGIVNAERVELASCGHSPHRDQAEAVLAAVAEFLHDAVRGA
jgi:pimeloyl-ACP methyl ester carboxylesterase